MLASDCHEACVNWLFGDDINRLKTLERFISSVNRQRDSNVMAQRKATGSLAHIIGGLSA